MRANHFSTLGLTPDADLDAVKRAFRRLAATLHPDTGPRSPADLARLARITEAYTALKHPDRLEEYRARLAAAVARPRAATPTFKPNAATPTTTAARQARLLQLGMRNGEIVVVLGTWGPVPAGFLRLEMPSARVVKGRAEPTGASVTRTFINAALSQPGGWSTICADGSLELLQGCRHRTELRILSPQDFARIRPVGPVKLRKRRWSGQRGTGAGAAGARFAGGGARKRAGNRVGNPVTGWLSWCSRFRENPRAVGNTDWKMGAISALMLLSIALSLFL